MGTDMDDVTPDFGTGLRAHLRLDQDRVEVVAEPETLPEPVAEVEQLLPEPELQLTSVAAVAVDIELLEDELLEREHDLTRREASLAGRAGSLLAAAQALYDEVLGGGPSPHDDELAQLRRRKSVA
jgi:hypothetical protein